MTNDHFVAKVCMPMKFLETWDKLMVHRYATVARQSSAYGRLLTHLRTVVGLQTISAVMATIKCVF